MHRLSKFLWVAGFVAAFAVPLAAQQELTFKVTPAELDVLAKGLESQPYKDVVPLLQKLREQLVAQQQPPKTSVPPAPPVSSVPSVPSVPEVNKD